MLAKDATASFPLKDLLIGALSRVDFAQSTERSPRALSVRRSHRNCNDGQLVFAATDGNCLVEAAPRARKTSSFPTRSCRRRFSSGLSKLLDGSDGDVEIALGGRQDRSSRVRRSVLTGKLVEGTYPDRGGA
jgi:acylphosphatase